uniref:Ion transport domain-containing protein n=1 Tax=Astatotilapia calliptera TaxID=8154 RepID=A0AAX7V817_ASTCA
MKKSEMFGFTLETDDRTEEERSRQKMTKKDGLALKLSPEDPKTPMDTDYQEEMEKTKPQIRFNFNFDKGIRGVDQHDNRRDSKTYNRDRLFEAVASRDISKLDGLQEYLRQNMKKLSDSLYRSYGKTPLMKALLHLKDGRNETVEMLIDISEKMGDVKEFVNAAYTNNYYKGQTALHIAIERRSIFYVKLLVSKGADVHVRACGKFFQPHKGPYFYFGELPLSLAACTNQPDVVDFLMDNEYQRADAKMVDSQGNTVLHALVMVADNSKCNTEFIVSMYDRILKITARLYPKVQLENIENKKGLTPLKMAAHTGKTGLFSHILRREFQETGTKHLSRKFTEWVYGPVHCSLYDLASVDSYEENSVLKILIYGSDIPNRHEMLETEPLIQLLEEKWNRFASGMFFFNFLSYLVYLIIFTLLSRNLHSCIGYILSIGIVLLLGKNRFFHNTLQINGLWKMYSTVKLLSSHVNSYYSAAADSLLQGVLFLISTGLHLFGRDEYLSFLVLCLALSWVNILYFSRGNEHMGIYSVMIQKMILSDILRFLFVYIVFLFGFSAAVVTLLKDPTADKSPDKELNTTNTTKSPRFLLVGLEEDCVKPTFSNISYTTLQLFKFTIGMGDMEFIQNYKYIDVFYVLLIFYIILTYILLLNMLIALMNRTVEKLTNETTSIWKLQRAITILDMERRLPCCLKGYFRCGVEKNLNTATGKDRRRCFRLASIQFSDSTVVSHTFSKGCKCPGHSSSNIGLTFVV